MRLTRPKRTGIPSAGEVPLAMTDSSAYRPGAALIVARGTSDALSWLLGAHPPPGALRGAHAMSRAGGAGAGRDPPEYRPHLRPLSAWRASLASFSWDMA